jgi:two-component system chemotaxis sensor kinase CheA
VFAIPLTAVREIIQIAPYEIVTIEGFEVIKFREETIPVLRIDELFKLKEYHAPEHPGFLVLATAGTRTVGLLVEQLIGEQDVVIKPLAEHVCEIRGLAGSTILGDGTIALVLDVAEMIEDVMTRQRQWTALPGRFVSAQDSNRHDQSLDV